MKMHVLAAAALLALPAAPSFAQPMGHSGGYPAVGRALSTSRGRVITTGHVGNVGTTTLPGGAGQKLPLNNGNGTSTLTGPGGTVTTVPTPG